MKMLKFCVVFLYGLCLLYISNCITTEEGGCIAAEINQSTLKIQVVKLYEVQSVLFLAIRYWTTFLSKEAKDIRESIAYLTVMTRVMHDRYSVS